MPLLSLIRLLRAIRRNYDLSAYVSLLLRVAGLELVASCITATELAVGFVPFVVLAL